MYSYGTIREFKTPNFRVVVDAVKDDCTDLSWDDTGEVLAKLESGEYLAFGVRARVFHKDLGEVSADYLGGCIYESIDAFQDHRECGAQTRKLRESGSNAICGSYFHDMITESIREARKAILKAQGIRVRDPN
jgi:hypothetical protein